MTDSNNVRGGGSSMLILGPDPDKSPLGGVAQHMRILRSLNALKNAAYFDPGSVQGLLGPGSIRVLKNCLLLNRLLRAGRYHQVWINASIYSGSFLKLLLLLLSSAKTRHPRIHTHVFFHGGRFDNIKFLRFGCFRQMARLVLQGVEGIHFLSRIQGNGFQRVFPGIPWQLFKNYLPRSDLLVPRGKGERLVALFVGRMVRSKGIFDILSAAAGLEPSFRRRIEIRFAGDGEDMAAFVRASASLAGQQIKILGQLTPSQLENVYAEADCLLLPSYHQEGFPYVVIEAMRAGLAVVATPTGAIADVIKHGVNGLLVPPRDPSGLRAAIRLLVDDRATVKKMGDRNRTLFLKQYSKTAAEAYYSCMTRAQCQTT